MADTLSPFTPHPPEVKERARELFLSGEFNKAQIAGMVGVSRPTLTKWLADQSVPAAPAPDGVTPESAGDAIIRNITSTKGGRARKADPMPKQQAAPAAGSGTSKVSDAELTKALQEVLCFPAIPMQMIVGCSFCAEHFAMTGGPAAVELVRLSQNSPGLRSALERLHAIYRVLMTGGILAMYAGKPLIHHLAPNDVLAFAGPFIGVPPRQDMASDPRVVATPMPAAGGFEATFGADSGHVHYDDGNGSQASADPYSPDSPAVSADAA